MVEATGAAPGNGAYQPVDLPELVRVEADAAGHPMAIKIRRHQPVIAIEDRWRVDDEWWRKEPVSRMYYSVRLSSGQHLVIFHDLIKGNWYRQAY